MGWDVILIIFWFSATTLHIKPRMDDFPLGIFAVNPWTAKRYLVFNLFYLAV